jgi:hypothetical protein
MRWPAAPTCHQDEQSPPFWRDPQPDLQPEGVPFRTCSSCGSIHPEDLIKYLRKEARLSEPVWAYGFPAIFHVHNIANPQAGRLVQVGIDFRQDGGQTVEEPLMSHGAPLTHARWMTCHLMDDYDEEALDVLLLALNYQTTMTWCRDERGIKYTTYGMQSIPH